MRAQESALGGILPCAAAEAILQAGSTRGHLSRDMKMYILILSMYIFLWTWYDKAEPLAARARA